MLVVTNMRVKSLSRDFLDLYWEIEDTVERVTDYTMQVLRSEAPEGRYTAICPEFRDAFHFRDRSVDLGVFNRQWHYRIRVKNTATDETADYPDVGGAARRARPTLQALEAARLARLALREACGGRKVVVLPRRTFGQTCDCIDDLTGQREDDGCTSCYGGGYTGGFHRPILVDGGVSSSPKLSISMPVRDRNANEAWLFVADYPTLQPEWVLVEEENIRWRIGAQITLIERFRYPVLQRAKLQRIMLGDPEYAFPINIDLENFEATARLEYSNPRNLGSESQLQAPMTNEVS